MEGLKQFIEQTIKSKQSLTITTGVVTEVNGDVCLVERDGLTDLVDVRLNSIEADLDQYFRIVPKIGSIVQCGIIENKNEDAFIVAYSEIENIEIIFGDDIKMMFNNQVITFNDGALGGVVIAPELTTQLAVLSARVDTLVQAIKTGTTGSSDGGAAYKASMGVIIDSNTNVEDFSNIEDDKILH